MFYRGRFFSQRPRNPDFAPLWCNLISFSSHYKPLKMNNPPMNLATFFAFYPQSQAKCQVICKGNMFFFENCSFYMYFTGAGFFGPKTVRLLSKIRPPPCAPKRKPTNQAPEARAVFTVKSSFHCKKQWFMTFYEKTRKNDIFGDVCRKQRRETRFTLFFTRIS